MEKFVGLFVSVENYTGTRLASGVIEYANEVGFLLNYKGDFRFVSYQQPGYCFVFQDEMEVRQKVLGEKFDK